MPPAFRSLDSSPIVKTLRLNHAAHFSVGTGAYPIAPTEDFSARPVGDFSDGPKFLLHPEKQKTPRPFPGAGFSVFSFFTPPCLRAHLVPTRWLVRSPRGTFHSCGDTNPGAGDRWTDSDRTARLSLLAFFLSPSRGTLKVGSFPRFEQLLQ